MRVSRRSWHYRFLEWMDMVPYHSERTKVTVGQYRYTVVLSIFYFIFFGWMTEGLRHLASKINSKTTETVEFYDGENDDEYIDDAVKI